mmetsp:Transcript_46922/g.120676  ORF Transcript_46922/g.120676 Transcript_46922/m.120676 type:complete len:81 (-) Transcript_46922:312-554(-)
MREGFKASRDGMFGPGLYVTTDKSKAVDFAKSHGNDGRVIRADAHLDRTTMVDASRAREGGFSERTWQNHYDSAYTAAKV